jgi:hypothetical protein
MILFLFVIQKLAFGHWADTGDIFQRKDVAEAYLKTRRLQARCTKQTLEYRLVSRALSLGGARENVVHVN